MNFSACMINYIGKIDICKRSSTFLIKSRYPMATATDIKRKVHTLPHDRFTRESNWRRCGVLLNIYNLSAALK